MARPTPESLDCFPNTGQAKRQGKLAQRSPETNYIAIASFTAATLTIIANRFL